ncbi:MAG TPA: hypothetical protein VFY04_03265 [Solirubrobacterales bacterium]|nr:hypothetical protein [Solirubrobacterales bacterium]
MAVPNRLLNAVTSRFASEAGFAVPTVTLMMVAALGMAGIAVSTSIQGQGGAVRDQRSKSALAVAESGVAEALLRFNRAGVVDESTPCAPVETTMEADGWCGAPPPTNVGGGIATFRVRPTASEMPNGEFAFTELEAVSEATVNGVTRKVEVTASSSSGMDPFIDASVKSKDGIHLDSNAEIHAGSATNGDITLDDNARQCGIATVGIGKALNGNGYFADLECGVVGGTPGEDEIRLDPVDASKAAISNDNSRLFSQDLISGNKSTVCFNGLNGKGAPDDSCGARELVIGSNSSVTLGGTVYIFCKVRLDSNSSLYTVKDKQVWIYFDSPEACGYEDEDEPVTQLEMRSNSRITSEAGKANKVALLFVGSDDIATKVLMNSETAVDGPCEQNFAVYGPYTDIELDSNTKFCGGLAGKTVTLHSNAEVWTSSGIHEFYLPLTAPHFIPNRFVDCSTAPAVIAPDEGC